MVDGRLELVQMHLPSGRSTMAAAAKDVIYKLHTVCRSASDAISLARRTEVDGRSPNVMPRSLQQPFGDSMSVTG